MAIPLVERVKSTRWNFFNHILHRFPFVAIVILWFVPGICSIKHCITFFSFAMPFSYGDSCQFTCFFFGWWGIISPSHHNPALLKSWIMDRTSTPMGSSLLQQQLNSSFQRENKALLLRQFQDIISLGLTLTHLFNMQIHSNNTVALTTAVQRPNKGRCLQLGYRVVSRRSQSAFIVFNQTIRLLRCSFLKTEKIAKWKLLSIAWDIFNLKLSLEKKDFRKMGLLAYIEIICLTEMKCVLLMLKVHTQ